MPWDKNGHQLYRDKFCTNCGEQPITKCEKDHEIREVNDDYGIPVRPDYCHECGAKYPWVLEV